MKGAIMKCIKYVWYPILIFWACNILSAHTTSYDQIENWWISYNKSQLLLKNHDINNALIESKKSLKIAENIPGRDLQKIIKSTAIIGKSYRLLGKYDEAELVLKKALNYRLTRYGNDHLDYVKGYFDLGLLYFQTQNYEKAEAMLKHGIEIIKQSYGENSTKLMNCLKLLALVKLQQEKYEDTEKILKVTIELSSQELLWAQNVILSNYQDLLRLYDETQDKDKIDMVRNKISKLKLKFGNK